MTSLEQTTEVQLLRQNYFYLPFCPAKLTLLVVISVVTENLQQSLGKNFMTTT